MKKVFLKFVLLMTSLMFLSNNSGGFNMEIIQSKANDFLYQSFTSQIEQGLDSLSAPIMK